MIQTTVLTAHTGHWLVSLAYIAPVVCFAIWIAYVTVRDRRVERSAGGDAKPRPGGRRTPRR